MREDPGFQDIGSAEEATRTALLPELERHLNLTAKAYNLITDVFDALPNLVPDASQHSMRSCILLLLRLANDLRTAQLLASLGYPAQAAALVATMYEVAFTIAYIGNDETLGNKWQNHDDPTSSFAPVTKLTRVGLKKLGAPNIESEAERHYKKYSQLCWGKHAWPLVQMTLSVATLGDDQFATYGPSASDESIRAAWFTLENAVWFVYIGVRAMLYFHGREPVPPAIDQEIGSIIEEYKKLQTAFQHRWNTGDPFPGKWRTFGRRK